MLNNEAINDRRLVSNILEAQYPHYTRCRNQKDLIGIYTKYPNARSRWYPKGRMNSTYIK